MTNDQIVTEEEVNKSLGFLRDGAKRLGQLTNDASFADSWVKVVLAVMMNEADGPGNAREREALASPEYEHAIRERARTAGELATEKALREAAAMKLEIYRTQSSNWRSMKV